MTDEAICDSESSNVIKGAIWHSLNHYQFEDALFMAERLVAESQNQEEVFLLATCHYRMNNKWATKEILEKYGYESSKCKFLYTRVLIDLKEESKALTELSGSCLTLSNNGEYSRDVSDFIYEFRDSTSFALIMAAELHQSKRQYDRAAECYKKALVHNPFLFTPYQRLCQIGKGTEPENVFNIAKYPHFELKNCLSPYKELDDIKFSQAPKSVETPQGKKSKQALQTVNTNSGLFQSPETKIATTPQMGRTVSTPMIFTGMPRSTTIGTPIQMVDPLVEPIGISPITSETRTSRKNTSKAARNMIVMVQNQTNEMKKHLNKYKEKGQMQRTTRSSRGSRGGALQRQLAVSTGTRKETKENLKITKPLTRSSTVDPSKAPQSGIKPEPEEDKNENVTIPDHYKTEKLTKKRTENEEAEPRKILLELLSLYKLMASAYWARCQHRFDEAKKSLELLPHSQKETGWVLNQLAKCCVDSEKHLAAIEIYKKIQTLEPYRLSGLEYYSTCLFYRENTTALSALSSEFLTKARHRPETWCIAGNLLSLNQDHATAKKYFHRAVEMSEETKETSAEVRHYAYILLGHELILEEEFAKAKDAFRKAIKISPNIINAWVGVAQVAMHELNFIEANGIYKKVLAYVPKSQQVIANLGRSYYEIKQYDHAIKCFKKVLKTDPKHPICLFFTAIVKYELGRFEECLKDLKKLDEYHPNNSQINYQLGKVYNKLGNYNLAFAHMTRATKLDPKGTAKQKDSFNMTNDSSTLDNMTNETGDFDTTDESTVDPRLLLPNFEGETHTVDHMEDSRSLQNLDELLEGESSEEY